MRKLPTFFSIAAFASIGLALGLFTGKINRTINIYIHRKFKKDGPLITGTSLIIQFLIIISFLHFAATHMPWITPENLGGGIASFAMGNLYFSCQTHFIQELTKFVDGRFDGLESYTI